MRSTLALALYGVLGIAALPLPALAQANPYAPMVTTPPGPQNPVNLNLEDPGAQRITPPAFTNNAMAANSGMIGTSSPSGAPGPAVTPFTPLGMAGGGLSTVPGTAYGGLSNAPGIGAGGLSVVPGGVH